MKKYIFCFIVLMCTLGSAYAQLQGFNPSSIEKIAKDRIVFRLKNIEGLTEPQIDKLVEIDLKIDKELPFLTTLFVDNVKMRERMDKVGIMKETLYKDVLTPKQMEEFSRLVKASKELRDSKSKSKNQKNKLKKQ